LIGEVPAPFGIADLRPARHRHQSNRPGRDLAGLWEPSLPWRGGRRTCWRRRRGRREVKCQPRPTGHRYTLSRRPPGRLRANQSAAALVAWHTLPHHSHVPVKSISRRTLSEFLPPVSAYGFRAGWRTSRSLALRVSRPCAVGMGPGRSPSEAGGPCGSVTLLPGRAQAQAGAATGLRRSRG
jgi:hypothetical protein